MDLNRLVKDLEEIKGCIEDNHIEKAEDLLGFVIGEVAIAAQHRLHMDGATPTEASATCPHCGNQVKLVAAETPRQ
jgi:hypothetical protein